MDRVRNIAETSLLLLGLCGNVFLWFESDWFRSSAAYFGLFISSLIIVIAGSAAFPASYKATLRTLSFLFLINFQEQAICNARSVFADIPAGSPQTDDQYRLVRCGSFFALFSTYTIFASRVVFPEGKPLSQVISTAGIRSVRGISFLVAAFFLIIAQCISWGVKEVCTNPPPFAIPLNITPLTIAIFLIFGVVQNDRELLDLGVFLSVGLGFTIFKVIFNALGITFAQDDYKDIWRAQMSFGFMACVIVAITQLQHSIRFGRTEHERNVSIMDRVKSMKFVALLALTLIGFSGAVCVWARSPESGHTGNYVLATLAWYATFGGLVVPVFSLIAWSISTPGAGVLAVFMANPASELFAAYLLNPALVGYLRGGAILVLLAAFFSPLIALSDGVAIAPNPEIYFDGKNKTPMAICLLLGCCALLWWDEDVAQYHMLWLATAQISVLFFFSASTGNASFYKTVSFVLMFHLTSPSLWPTDRTSFISSPATIAFVIVGWSAVTYVTFVYPGATFECFHDRNDYQEMIEVQAPFIETKSLEADESSVARVYMSADTGSNQKDSGFITEDK